MPSIGELASRLIGAVGDAVNASSARLGPAATGAILIVVLVLLALLARPVTRWTLRDLGRLASLPHALALTAEAGERATISLATSGIARSTSAVNRLQTIAALPLVAYVTRSAARSGVALDLTANDPVAVQLAGSIVASAHTQTATAERAGRSRVRYVGEGRATEAARALAAGERGGAAAGRHGMAVVLGGVAEESLLLMTGAAASASTTIAGTADASEATSVLLAGDGTLVGAELFDASADLAAGSGRAAVLAGNRLIWAATAILVLGSVLQLLGAVDIAGFLVGRS